MKSKRCSHLAFSDKNCKKGDKCKVWCMLKNEECPHVTVEEMVNHINQKWVIGGHCFIVPMPRKCDIADKEFRNG